MSSTLHKHRIILFILVSIPLVLLFAYGLSRRLPVDSPDQHDGTIRVVTSIHPLSCIVRAVGGDSVHVITLLSPGGSAHLHEISPSTLGEVSDADLLVRVGGGLDDWAELAFDVSSQDCIQVRLIPALRQVISGNEDTEWLDPHIWLDPLLVRDRVTPLIADFLSDLHPEESPQFRSNAHQFRSELTELHEDIQEMFADVQGRGFIADHPAWSHFAGRYGLWQVGVLEETPGHECGPREIGTLVDTARAEGISVVTTTRGHGAMLAEALADEIDAVVLELDPIGGGPSGPGSYLELLRSNAQSLADALTAQP